MKKILKDIGILGLACFSFLITDNTIEVVKEKDSLMINLRSVAEDYKIAEIDGMIDDKYIKLDKESNKYLLSFLSINLLLHKCNFDNNIFVRHNKC